MSSPARNKSRTGFTLIEVAVVVSITSLLFALSVTTLVALLRIERQCAADLAQDRAVGRLASRFRQDVHTAAKASCADDCLLDLGNEKSIRYTFSPPAVIREVRSGDKTEHRDSFLLDKNASVSFSLAPESNNRLIQMHLSRVGSRPPLSAVPLEITAAIDLHSLAPPQSENASPTAEAAP